MVGFVLPLINAIIVPYQWSAATGQRLYDDAPERSCGSRPCKQENSLLIYLFTIYRGIRCTDIPYLVSVTTFQRAILGCLFKMVVGATCCRRRHLSLRCI